MLKCLVILGRFLLVFCSILDFTASFLTLVCLNWVSP
uniref:Uncharacterized protein n=1 Tax=Lepeophtheirus salmonis TaxID=72036 RepID=A0A0K2TD72_LEPSM